MADPISGEFKGEKFKRETIKLDGSKFENCQFEACAFVYGGGAPPGISGCGFNSCTWSFSDDAANTIAFLSGFYNGGFADLIEATFHEIRKGDMIKPAAKSEPAKAKSGKFFGLEPLKIFKVPKKK